MLQVFLNVVLLEALASGRMWAEALTAADEAVRPRYPPAACTAAACLSLAVAALTCSCLAVCLRQW